MPSFEFVRDERGNETLIQVPDFNPSDIQDPDDIQPSNPDVVGPITSIINEIALFSNTTGDELKQSDVLIIDKDLIGLHKLTVGDSTNVGELCIYSETDDLINIKGPPSATPYTLTLPVDDGNAGENLSTDGAGILSWTSSTGDVNGPGSSTDNAIVRWDGTDGKLVQDSVLTVDANGNISRSASPWIHELGGANNFSAGTNSLAAVTDGFRLTAVGHGCLNAITSEDECTAMGYQCLNNCTAFAQTGYGSRCMANQTSGIQNSGFGFNALNANLTGTDNTMFGFQAGVNLINSDNSAFGSDALSLGGTTTQGNSVLGHSALNSMTTGNFNIAIGDGSGGSHVSGDNNIYLAHTGASSESGQIYIGSSGTHTKVTIAGVFNVTPSGGSDEMMIMDSTGQTGTQAIKVGDVVGPGSATDNAIVRFNGTTGKLIQNSSITIDDSGNLGVAATISTTENILITASDGQDNTKYGYKALEDITSIGLRNVAVGESCLGNLTGGDNNVGIGTNAGFLTKQAANCVIIGYQALSLPNGGATRCIAIGANAITAGSIDTSPIDNIAIGYNNMADLLDDGDFNVSVGNYGMRNNTEGTRNASLGHRVLWTNIVGNDNATVGFESLELNTGSRNSCVGSGSGKLLTTGSDNICISHPGVAGESGQIRLGNSTDHVVIHFKDGLQIDTNDDLLATDAFKIQSVDTGVESLHLFSTLGTVHIESNSVQSADGIFIECASGTNSLLTLRNVDSTNASSIKIVSTAGGIDIDSALDTTIVSGSSNAVSFEGGTGGVQIHGDAGLQIYEPSSGSEKVSILAPALSSDWSLTLPVDDGSSGEFLQTNGSGVTAWEMPAYTPNFLDGMKLRYVSATTVSIASGDCRDSTNVFNLILSSLTNIVITTTGAGGLQTSSSEAADTWYDCLVIGDTTGVNATTVLMKPQGTAFSESGYDVFRFLSSVRNDGSSDFLQFILHRNDRSRHYQWLESRSQMMAFDSNVATGGVFQVLDLLDFVPAGTSMCDVAFHVDLITDSDKLYLQSGINAQTTSNAIMRLGPGEQSPSSEFMDSLVYNVPLNPMGGTGSTPSMEIATSDNTQDLQLVISAFTVNL